MSKYQPRINVGYLGGGQLARMLSESALNLGLTPHVLSSNHQDPAAQSTGQWHKGDTSKAEDLQKFLEQVQVATFESEFLDATLLTEIQKKVKAKIYPSPKTMGLLQDRKTQKNLFDQNRLPTSSWACVDKKEDVESFVERYKLPVVFKKRFFGYDGYGTFIIKNKVQLNEFLSQYWEDELFIVEKFIPFKKEAAVMIARSSDGSNTHFPFVESKQKDARCDWIKGPIQGKAYTDILKKLKRFLNKTKYVGVMGVEFFVTTKGLIINEVAPRVHNTGHYSQDTMSLSQFDVHNMCLLGQKLPKEIKIKKSFAMANLIGSGQTVKLKAVEGLHWYGKKENRPGRKMGHINATGSTPAEALRKVLKKRGEQKL